MEREEKSNILKVEQVFFSEIVFIGLFSIKILPMEIRLASFSFASQNTKKAGERKTGEEGERK